jgi:hypothetical protein
MSISSPASTHVQTTIVNIQQSFLQLNSVSHAIHPNLIPFSISIHAVQQIAQISYGIQLHKLSLMLILSTFFEYFHREAKRISQGSLEFGE